MTTPDSVPSPDGDFLASEPLLRNWLSSTLEQSSETSRADLQLATLKKIEEYDFAVDPDLELACSLLAGNECRDGSQKLAVRSQLKKEVEQFAQEFFSHEVRNRLLLFEELNERCSEHAGLVARLNLLKPGLQVDAAAVEGLDGKTAELGNLTLELFVLPHLEQAQTRRQRLSELLESSPKSAKAALQDWQSAATELRKTRPQIAMLDDVSINALSYASAGFGCLRRKKITIGARQSGWKSTNRILLIVLVVGWAGLSYTLENNRPGQSKISDRGRAFELAEAEKQRNWLAARGDLESTDDSSVSEDTMAESQRFNVEELKRALGEEGAMDLLNRISGERNSNDYSLVVAKDSDDISTEIADAIRDRSLAKSVVQLRVYTVKGEKTSLAHVVGLPEQVRNNSAQKFEAALGYLHENFRDSLIEPVSAVRKHQLKQQIEILDAYDEFLREDYKFTSDSEAIIRELRGSRYEIQSALLVTDGDTLSAIETLDEGIGLLAENAALYAARGVLRENSDPQKAIADLTRAIELEPDNGLFRFQRGRVWHVQKNHKRALPDYDKSLELDPELDLALRSRGLLKESIRDLNGAISDFDAYLILEPDDVQILLKRGHTYLQQANFKFAKTDFLAGIALDPELAVGWGLYGNALGLEKKYPDAIKALERAIDLDPQDFWSIRFKAECEFSDERYEQAVETATHLIEKESGFTEAWTLRSHLRARNGQIKLALIDINEAIRREKGKPRNHWVRGYIRCQQRLFSDAIVELDRAIAINPNFAEAHAFKAMILASCPDESIRDVERARSEAARSVELTAQWSSAISLDALAVVDAVEGDFKSAVENLSKALGVATGVDDLDDMKARLELFKAGKPFVLPAAVSEAAKKDGSTEVSDD